MSPGRIRVRPARAGPVTASYAGYRAGPGAVSGRNEEGADLAGDAVRLVEREEGTAALDLDQAGIGKCLRQPPRERQREEPVAGIPHQQHRPGEAAQPRRYVQQGGSDPGSESDIGLVMQLITRGIELGRIRPQPVVPLARILLGALREAALFLASAPDPAAARDQVGAVLNRIIESAAVVPQEDGSSS